MAILPRVVSLTPLDTLRVQLTGYSEGDTALAGLLAASMQSLRHQALPVVGPKLVPGQAPKGLRRLLLSLVPRFDWPAWAPWIREGLLTEPDLGTFDEGCAALGALGTREALEALKSLQSARGGQEHQTILARELSAFQAQQSFAHYLGRVMEGAGNPRLATQGAKALVAMAGPGDLPALAEAYGTGDALVQQLALRLLGGLPGPEGTAFFLALVARLVDEILDNHTLLALLHKTQALARASARAELRRLVAERFQERLPEEVGHLEDALKGNADDIDAHSLLEPFLAVAHGHSDHFLLEALGLLIENKVARFSAYHSESSDAAEARDTHLNATLDQAAEALARRVSLGFATPEETLPVLAKPFRVHLGGDGLLQSFLNLLPAGETGLLDEILRESDPRRRQRCLELLGNREDNDLTPFFLKAMQDPIVEVGQLASLHLSKLPSSLPSLMAQFQSGQLDQVRRAIWAFGENQTREAAEPLLAFIRDDPRDELLVEAVEALANLRYPAALPTFLDLLHDGKPLALQVCLARALGLMGLPEASLGLLQKAPQLKHPQVLILCLEGALSAFPGFERPLPAEHIPALLALVERCCDEREGEGQRLPAMLATMEFYAFEQAAYDRLKDRFSDYLFNMRTRENWDRDSNERVAAVVKELGRRSGSLALLAKKEGEVKALALKLGETGPRRTENLLALREALSDPDLILRHELSASLAGQVLKELQKKQPEWKETAYLCEIGGLTRQSLLVEPLRAILLQATGLGLKSACRKALLNLGLSEGDIDRKPPVRSILVLEPSAFFRRRLVSSLAAPGRWQLREAGSRSEAEALLQEAPSDLLLSESNDPEGPLGDWLEQQWSQGRCRSVFLSASSRDLGSLPEAPWVDGTLFKPYPIDQLLRALEA